MADDTTVNAGLNDESEGGSPSNRRARQRSETILVGISGVSSSGKTTVARLLRDLWPRSFILHEDDFYLPDKQIPVKNGVQDWDCLEALDLGKMRKSLLFIQEQGTLPPDLDSKEDQNSVGKCDVDPEAIEALRQRVQQLLEPIKGAKRHGELDRAPKTLDSVQIAFVEGFLLYAKPMQEIWELLDVRLFLRTSYATAKERREARMGYVTIDGFWEDPPGYVDKVVWPNYVADHGFLFMDGDVEGQYNESVCNAMSLSAIPEKAQNNMTECLSWAFDRVFDKVQAVLVPDCSSSSLILIY